MPTKSSAPRLSLSTEPRQSGQDLGDGGGPPILHGSSEQRVTIKASPAVRLGARYQLLEVEAGDRIRSVGSQRGELGRSGMRSCPALMRNYALLPVPSSAPALIVSCSDASPRARGSAAASKAALPQAGLGLGLGLGLVIDLVLVLGLGLGLRASTAAQQGSIQRARGTARRRWAARPETPEERKAHRQPVRQAGARSGRRREAADQAAQAGLTSPHGTLHQTGAQLCPAHRRASFDRNLNIGFIKVLCVATCQRGNHSHRFTEYILYRSA